MQNRILILLAGALAPLTGFSGSYETAYTRLAASNPEFVFHANLEGDFAKAGDLLSDFYLSYLQMNPEVPPIPVDFQRIFNRLGLANLNSVTFVSEKSAKGGFLNQSLFLFEGRPSGVFHLTGQENRPFTILNEAPADADLFAEFNFNGPVLYEIIRGLVIDAMGPMGEGLIQMQMSQPLNEEGMTLMDLVNRLQTRAQVAVKASDAALNVPGIIAVLQGQACIRLGGLGDLLASLEPMLLQGGFAKEENRYRMTLPLPGLDGGLTVIIESQAESGDLLVCFSELSRDWFLNPTQPAITSPDVIKAIMGFPDTGLSIWYSNERIAELQISGMDAQLQEGAEAPAFLGSLKKFLMEFTGPQAGVTFLEEDAHRSMAWQPTSYKTNLAIAGMAVPIGIATAIAEEAGETGQEPEADEPPAEEEAAPELTTGACMTSSVTRIWATSRIEVSGWMATTRCPSISLPMVSDPDALACSSISWWVIIPVISPASFKTG